MRQQHKSIFCNNTSLKPSLNELQTIQLISPDKITLPNNIELISMRAKNVDLIKLTIIFKDNSVWNKQDALNSVAVGKLVKEGSINYSSDKLKSFIEFNGAKLFTSSNSDYICIDLYTIKENFAKTLGILKEIIVNATFPESEINKFINESTDRLLVNMQKNHFLANRALKKLVFGNDNKLGFSPEAEDYSNISRDTLYKYYKENFAANNCTVIATGNISRSDMEALKDTLNSLYCSSPVDNIINEPDNQKNALNLKTNKHNKQHIKGVNKLQSTILIGKKFPNRNHPDYLQLQILNTILGGYFGSYLMKNLREDKGYTYGIHSNIVSNLQTGLFYISTEVNINNYKPALKEIYKEIDNLSSNNITNETINIIKNYSIGDFRSSIKNIFSYSNLIISTLFYNISYPSYYRQYFEELQSIDKKKLKQLAAKYFTDGFSEVIVGV